VEQPGYRALAEAGAINVVLRNWRVAQLERPSSGALPPAWSSRNSCGYRLEEQITKSLICISKLLNTHYL
jgi:hypothetical protein